MRYDPHLALQDVRERQQQQQQQQQQQEPDSVLVGEAIAVSPAARGAGLGRAMLVIRIYFPKIMFLLREFGFIDFSLFLSGVLCPQPATRAISSVRSPRSLPRVRHWDLLAEAVCKGGIPGEIGRAEGVYLPFLRTFELAGH